MKSDPGTHEDFGREEEVKGSSNRSFGLVFAAFFVIVGVVKALHDQIWSLAWFAAAAIMLVISFAAPHWLAPLNRLWTKFGLLLFKVINPIVMLLVYAICIVPMGVVMRQFGWDPMRRKFDAKAESYWIQKTQPGSMKNQF